MLIVLVSLQEFLLKFNSLFMLTFQLHVQFKHLVLLYVHSLEYLFRAAHQCFHVCPILTLPNAQLLLFHESRTINIFYPLEYFGKEVHTCQILSFEQDVFQI
jgi:hypothetical protein